MYERIIFAFVLPSYSFSKRLILVQFFHFELLFVVDLIVCPKKGWFEFLAWISCRCWKPGGFEKEWSNHNFWMQPLFEKFKCAQPSISTNQPSISWYYLETLSKVWFELVDLSTRVINTFWVKNVDPNCLSNFLTELDYSNKYTQLVYHESHHKVCLWWLWQI